MSIKTFRIVPNGSTDGKSVDLIDRAARPTTLATHPPKTVVRVTELTVDDNAQLSMQIQVLANTGPMTAFQLKKKVARTLVRFLTFKLRQV